jgi:hypothetical protein
MLSNIHNICCTYNRHTSFHPITEVSTLINSVTLKMEAEISSQRQNIKIGDGRLQTSVLWLLASDRNESSCALYARPFTYFVENNIELYYSELSLWQTRWAPGCGILSILFRQGNTVASSARHCTYANPTHDKPNCNTLSTVLIITWWTIALWWLTIRSRERNVRVIDSNASHSLPSNTPM